MWNERVMAYFKVLLHTLPGEIMEKHKNLRIDSNGATI
jgi:hypothetical protein